MKTIYFDSLLTLSSSVIQNFTPLLLQGARSLVTLLFLSTTRPWYFSGIKTQGILVQKRKDLEGRLVLQKGNTLWDNKGAVQEARS